MAFLGAEAWLNFPSEVVKHDVAQIFFCGGPSSLSGVQSDGKKVCYSLP